MATLWHVFAYLGHWLPFEWPLVRCAVWIQNANLPFCRLCNCSGFCNLNVLFYCRGSTSVMQNLCLFFFLSIITSPITYVPKNELEEEWFDWPLRRGSKVQVGPIHWSNNDSRLAFVREANLWFTIEGQRKSLPSMGWMIDAKLLDSNIRSWICF